MCKLEKPINSFYKHPLAKDGYHTRCQKCLREATRISRYLHPEKWRSYGRVSTLRNRYGLEIDDYEALAKAQEGKCAICETIHVNRRGANNFAVDHDHVTGAVRGLLCHKCNRGLGCFNDSAELVIKAALYLKSQKEAKSA